MEGITLIGPPRRRLVAAAARQPDTPSAARLAARAQRLIDDIDRAVDRPSTTPCYVCGFGLDDPGLPCPACALVRTDHRSAPPDERPVGVPVEYAAGGRILSVR
jgi:hypothetical protein